MPDPLRVFISYAHLDEAFKERLLSHLAVLRRKKLVAVWHDRQIDGGANWRAEIRQAMDDCTLALLLVSDDFLNSEFIASEEMELLWLRRERDGLRLAPIILRPCAWQLDRLGDLQALPKDGKAIVCFVQDNGERDQAWTDIAFKIAEWARDDQPVSAPVAVAPIPVPAPSAPASVAAAEPESPVAAEDLRKQRLKEGLLSLWQVAKGYWRGRATRAVPALEGARSEPVQAGIDMEMTIAVAPALALPTAVNPFDPWNEAVPPRFVGRADLLRRLALALDEKRSVSLVGDWRIGKTSVLHTARLAAERSGRVVRLLSGEGAEAVSCAAIVGAISGLPQAADDADAAADQLSQWLETASPPGLPPLILIDEADRVLTRFPHRFFERLRGMLGRVCLVLATRQEVDRIYSADKRTSPFINRLEMQRLGLLDSAAAESLIAQGADILTEEDRELMRKWAGGHPYYLALLGRHLWDARRHGGTIAEALDIFRDEASARLRELWATLDETDRQQLRGMLKGEAVDGELLRRGLVVAGQAFGAVMTEWLSRKPR